MGLYEKYVEETIEFDVDCSTSLVNGDTVSAYQVVVLSGGVTASAPTLSGNVISFRVSGGTAGVIAYVAIKVTLGSGLYLESAIGIVVSALPD